MKHAANKNVPIFVIIGIGPDKQPHAGKYSNSVATQAAMAAILKRYRLASADDPKTQAIARELPDIRVSAGGITTIPRVSQAIYDHLMANLAFAKPPPKPQESRLEDLKGLIRNPWAAITRGSVVLAEDRTDGGLYEATVVGVTAKGMMLTLRWKDWPKQKAFSARRLDVGIPASARTGVVAQDRFDRFVARDGDMQLTLDPDVEPPIVVKS